MTKKVFLKIIGQNKLLCLLCNKTVAVNTEYNLKHLHEIKHKTISELKGIQRTEKLEKLKLNLEKQQSIFNKRDIEQSTTLRTVT